MTSSDVRFFHWLWGYFFIGTAVYGAFTVDPVWFVPTAVTFVAQQLHGGRCPLTLWEERLAKEEHMQRNEVSR